MRDAFGPESQGKETRVPSFLAGKQSLLELHGLEYEIELFQKHSKGHMARKGHEAR